MRSIKSRATPAADITYTRYVMLVTECRSWQASRSQVPAASTEVKGAASHERVLAVNADGRVTHAEVACGAALGVARVQAQG
eukprot:CAMPEP_0177257354 /NCGR_PEP_ID=MMETSP0367-20130122/57482_1 /TAXON_ID=447022 ORGANISM="Scrippsiella hangoei-like, Strain SHHI-4" /NCGR_SAMPLE_ID=MMETSP0367 /ASSEMBLY_ACC=CAM_ASM_000362 /LENGTH=81 /DNA_ID=CAMNT_0018711403 /DNA_START=353 /DNA_END=598 /DNA_ORIENTATION=+